MVLIMLLFYVSVRDPEEQFEDDDQAGPVDIEMGDANEQEDVEVFDEVAPPPPEPRGDRRGGRQRGSKMNVEALLEKQKKKLCKFCKRSAMAVDPRAPLFYISWDRCKPRLAEEVDQTGEPKPLGSHDTYCGKTHDIVPEYQKLTDAELVEHLSNEENMRRFETWRTMAIDKMEELGTMGAALVKAFYYTS